MSEKSEPNIHEIPTVETPTIKLDVNFRVENLLAELAEKEKSGQSIADRDDLIASINSLRESIDKQTNEKDRLESINVFRRLGGTMIKPEISPENRQFMNNLIDTVSEEMLKRMFRSKQKNKIIISKLF